jgi:hypothetical protein
VLAKVEEVPRKVSQIRAPQTNQPLLPKSTNQKDQIVVPKPTKQRKQPPLNDRLQLNSDFFTKNGQVKDTDEVLHKNMVQISHESPVKPREI